MAQKNSIVKTTGEKMKQKIIRFISWQMFFLGIQFGGFIGFILTRNNILFVIGVVQIAAIMLLFKSLEILGKLKQ